jgi:hypothetical protein
LKTKTKRPEGDVTPKAPEEELRPINTSIEDGLLRVVIKKKGEEIPIYIDLQKHLE